MLKNNYINFKFFKYNIQQSNTLTTKLIIVFFSNTNIIVFG